MRPRRRGRAGGAGAGGSSGGSGGGGVGGGVGLMDILKGMGDTWSDSKKYKDSKK